MLFYMLFAGQPAPALYEDVDVEDIITNVGYNAEGNLQPKCTKCLCFNVCVITIILMHVLDHIYTHYVYFQYTACLSVCDSDNKEAAEQIFKSRNYEEIGRYHDVWNDGCIMHIVYSYLPPQGQYIKR